MSKENIIVYGAAWCAYCHQTTQYLDKLGVKYTYKDIDLDPALAKEVADKSGQTGIPVTDIGGKIIVGFDRPTIDHILREKKLIS